MQRSRGFTLVEVLVATAILVTVAAGTAQLFTIAIRHTAASRQQIGMAIAAAQKIDELSALIARDVAPSAAIGRIDAAVTGFSDAASEAGARFERRWIIAPLTPYSATAVIIVVRVIPVARQMAVPFDLTTIAEAREP